MSILEQFEYPLPAVEANIEAIVIETSGGYESSFIVKNVGGSELEGKITSNSRAIVFSPVSFCGNHNEITYALNLENYKPGDCFHSSVLISSNGGEISIPVMITIVTPEITTKDGETIASLMDYYEYAKENPVPSRQLFVQHEFMMWLFQMGYKDMELYEHFVRDPNKERAVDNFLILNQLKKQTQVKVEDRHITVYLKPGSYEAETSVIRLMRSEWGYLDVALRYDVEANPWISFNKDKLVSSDFDEDDSAEIMFVVLPDKMEKRMESVFVELESRGEVIDSFYVHVSCQKRFHIQLSKLSYNFEDYGHITVINNTGEDVKMEVTAKDSFMRFEGRRYFVSKKAEVPFGIRFNPLQYAQMALKKQFMIESAIEVRIAYSGGVYKKTLPFQLSNMKEIDL